MSKHTESPWTYHEVESKRHGYDWQTFAVRDGVTNCCLAVVGEVDRATAEQNAANARLIAAAPDLAEGLRFILSRLNDYGGKVQQVLYSDSLHPVDDDKTVVDYIKETLAKAGAE